MRCSTRSYQDLHATMEHMQKQPKKNGRKIYSKKEEENEEERGKGVKKEKGGKEGEDGGKEG